MCKEIQVGSGQSAVMCGTVGELRAALQVERVFVLRDAFAPKDDDCLCSVDFERTAEAVGMRAKQASADEGFPYPEIIILSAL